MRHLAVVVVIGAFIGGVALAETAVRPAFVRVSPRDPRYFELADGRPYIPIGLNLIAPDGARGGGETNGLNRMDEWIKKLADQGGNYIRVWLSSPFWDVEHKQSGVYDETRARRIDALLEIARRRDVRVKLTLEHFRSIDGPGRQAWAHKPLHTVARGGTATNIADFFDGQASRDLFRRKLAWYAKRYPDNPTIYGWELWNEINAVAGGDYMSWTESMLPELHRLFPHNLAMQSLGSFDRDSELPAYRRLTLMPDIVLDSVRSSYRRLSLMPGNDVAQVHRYLDLGAALEVCHGPVDVLAADAVRELLAWHPERPVILAESGAVEPNHAGPFKLYATDRQGIILHDILFAPFFAGAAGPGQCWHWDQYVDRNNLWHHFGRFAAAVKDLDPPSEQFQPRMLPHERLRIYALAGRQTILLWCRDAQNTWQTELRDDRKPELLTKVTLDLAQVLAKQTIAETRVYDPWENRWTDARIEGQTLVFPEFSRSLVVRIGLDSKPR